MRVGCFQYEQVSYSLLFVFSPPLFPIPCLLFLFGNEKDAPHLNVDHIVGLELIESPDKLPAVSIRATRAECNLSIEFAAKVKAQDLIDAIIDYSLQSAATAFELVATTGAKPKLPPFARFVANEPYEPDE